MRDTEHQARVVVLRGNNRAQEFAESLQNLQYRQKLGMPTSKLKKRLKRMLRESDHKGF